MTLAGEVRLGPGIRRTATVDSGQRKTRPGSSEAPLRVQEFPPGNLCNPPKPGTPNVSHMTPYDLDNEEGGGQFPRASIEAIEPSLLCLSHSVSVLLKLRQPLFRREQTLFFSLCQTKHRYPRLAAKEQTLWVSLQLYLC